MQGIKPADLARIIERERKAHWARKAQQASDDAARGVA